MAVCRFPNTGDDWYVLVGVARDMILNPKSVGGGFIYTYRLVGGGEKLEFVHKVGSSVLTEPGSRHRRTPPPRVRRFRPTSGRSLLAALLCQLTHWSQQSPRSPARVEVGHPGHLRGIQGK